MRKRVVVVEDNSTSKGVIANRLASAGYAVEKAGRAAQAAKYFDGRPVDLLITDMDMPGVNAAELITCVRSMKGYGSVPVLLLASELPQQLDRIELEGNITACVRSPFETWACALVVEKTLG